MRSIFYSNQIPRDLSTVEIQDLFPFRAPESSSSSSEKRTLLIGPLDLLPKHEIYIILQALCPLENDLIFILFNQAELLPLICKYFPMVKPFLREKKESVNSQQLSRAIESDVNSQEIDHSFGTNSLEKKPPSLSLLSAKSTLQPLFNTDNLMQFLSFFACQKHSSARKRLGIPAQSGFLLSAPSGWGKTELTKLISQIVWEKWEIPTWKLNNALVFSSHLGESEQALREAFAFCKSSSSATTKKKKCILLLDGILDVLGREVSSSSSSGENSVEMRLSTTLLMELDGIEGTEWKENVLVIATTRNRHKLIPALTRAGRFDCHFDLSCEIEKLKIAFPKISNPNELDSPSSLCIKERQFAFNLQFPLPSSCFS